MFRHAQSLRSICTHLLKQFKRVPSADASQPLDEEHQHHQEQPVFQIRSPDNVLNLIWSIASLCADDQVPFAAEDARPFLQDLLLYIAHESDQHIMHALLCTLHILLKRLDALPAAAAAASAQAMSAHVQDKSATALTLLNILSQVLTPLCLSPPPSPFSPPLIFHIPLLLVLSPLHELTAPKPPCDMGCRGKAQPQDYSTGDRRSQGRGERRSLSAALAALQVAPDWLVTASRKQMR